MLSDKGRLWPLRRETAGVARALTCTLAQTLVAHVRRGNQSLLKHQIGVICRSIWQFAEDQQSADYPQALPSCLAAAASRALPKHLPPHSRGLSYFEDYLWLYVQDTAPELARYA